ncbi:mucin-2-like [Macrobrachium nipponense]|uniref:mucin-2-like n=1 Tax=Macrobrachium nipponense TaxID=159736 RepID=UPI0030C8A4A2
MKFLALLLVVGTTIPSLTSAMPQELPPLVRESVKKQITDKLCTGSPSTRSQCITEVEECMDFLQIDPTAEEMPEPNMDKICNGSAKLSDCIEKATKCSELLAKEPSDEPQSLTSLDTLPTKDNLETMCSFMKTENCTQNFEKCFDLIGPKANITGFPTREMFECSRLFDTYIEVTKNISGAIGTTEDSVDTTEEGSGPTKEMMEARCSKLQIENCVERVEKCFKLVGPEAANVRTPTREMIECSSFLAQFSDTTKGDVTETTEESNTTTTTTPAITRAQMETMCRSSDERNCVDRFEECLVMVGPGANVPRTPSREMTECTRFLDKFSDAMANITGTTGNTTTSTAAPVSGITGTTPSTTTTTTDRSTIAGNRRENGTTESSVRTGTSTSTTTTTTTTTTLRPGLNTTVRNSTSGHSKENITAVCDFMDIPNCPHRVEECFRMRENKNANRTEAEKCAQVVTSYENISKNLTERIEADRPPCNTDSCKRCETLLRPTRSFTSSQEECSTNTELTLKECMKPVMERHLNQVGRPDIRQHIMGFFNNCYPKTSFAGITPCIIARCAEII